MDQIKLIKSVGEALLNAATHSPSDDIMNRDGIRLVTQGLELILQAHREKRQD